MTGQGEELNQQLEKAGRVADFFELAELMCRDALHREESCGGHFREEQPDTRGRGEARRRALHLRRGLAVDAGTASRRALDKEPLEFERVHPSQRSYK